MSEHDVAMRLTSRKRTLEQALHALIGHDLLEALEAALVLVGVIAGSHHQATAHRVKGIGSSLRSHSHGVPDEELGPEPSRLQVCLCVVRG